MIIVLWVFLLGTSAYADSAESNLPDSLQTTVELATDAYISRLDSEARAASDRYFEGQSWLILWGLMYGLGIAWVLMRFGISVRMRDLSERLSRFKYAANCLYIVQYSALTFVMYFPLLFYEGFYREHQYDLSNLTFVDWFLEQLMGLGLDLTLGTLGLALIYVVIRRAPNSWAIWGAATTIAMLTFLMVISPVYLSPLFNDYTPLEDGPLKEEILGIARANGVPAENVYQFDASKQTTRISANVSGLFGTTRISLNDNLLNNTSHEGIVAVMAHEIGHYTLNHTIERLVNLSIIIVCAFLFLKWSFRLVARPSLGVRDVSDTAGLPILMALISIFFFLITPINNSIIRSNETEADYFAFNASGYPDGFAEAILSLSTYRKVHPGALEEFVLFDHPSGYNRIYRAMRWKAEHEAFKKSKREDPNTDN